MACCPRRLAKNQAWIFCVLVVVAACHRPHWLGQGKKSAPPAPNAVPTSTAAQAAPDPAPAAEGPVTPVPTIVDGPHLAGDVTQYARFCKQELGLPGAILKPWNCLDGVEVPVTVDGHDVAGEQYRDLAQGKIGCDRPSWLGDAPCANYGFVQKRQLAPRVEAYLLCRVRSFSGPMNRAERQTRYEASGRFEDFRALYDFDSFGLIWTHLDSGKTCYFDFVGRVYGGRVPSPDDESMPEFADLPDPKPPKELRPGSELEFAWKKNGRMSWRSPRDLVEHDVCVRCHDAYAVKITPWIKAALSLSWPSPDVPYSVVGQVFEPWRKKLPLRAISTTKVQGASGLETQNCTRCHRLGTQETCSRYIDYAIGAAAPAKLSALASSAKNRLWMPPKSGDLANLDDQAYLQAWHQAYQPHINKLKCCCATPQAKGCTLQEIGPDNVQAAREGEGPERCE